MKWTAAWRCIINPCDAGPIYIQTPSCLPAGLLVSRHLTMTKLPAMLTTQTYTWYFHSFFKSWWLGISLCPSDSFQNGLPRLVRTFSISRIIMLRRPWLLWWVIETLGTWTPFCWTHWGWGKNDTILQTTLWNAFSWMKMFAFQLKLHWSLFLRVQLTILQHWFR